MKTTPSTYNRDIADNMASANTLYIPDQAALYDIRASNQSRAMGVYQLDQSGVRG